MCSTARTSINRGFYISKLTRIKDKKRFYVFPLVSTKYISSQMRILLEKFLICEQALITTEKQKTTAVLFEKNILTCTFFHIILYVSYALYVTWSLVVEAEFEGKPRQGYFKNKILHACHHLAKKVNLRKSRTWSANGLMPYTKFTSLKIKWINIHVKLRKSRIFLFYFTLKKKNNNNKKQK